MSRKKYDVNKLNSSKKFDTSVSSRFYYRTQDYYDALTEFVEKYRAGFQNYTPAFVVNSDEDREGFLKECFEARAVYTQLGIPALIEELSVMEDAAINKKMKEFADGQIKFYATLRICKDIIKDAEIAGKA